MIGGITKGSCFSGCVEYALALKEKNKEARLLYSEGLMTDTPRDIIDGFECQRHLNSRLQHWCGHISLSYSPKDAERMSYNAEGIRDMMLCEEAMMVGSKQEQDSIKALTVRLEHRKRADRTHVYFRPSDSWTPESKSIW